MVRFFCGVGGFTANNPMVDKSLAAIGRQECFNNSSNRIFIEKKYSGKRAGGISNNYKGIVL